MTDIRSTLALILVLVALLLEVGCVGQSDTNKMLATGRNNAIPYEMGGQNTTTLDPGLRSTTSVGYQDIPAGNYVFVEHLVLPSRKTIAGECKPTPAFDGPVYSFDEQTGEFNAYLPSNKPINGSVRVIFARSEARRENNGLIGGGIGGSALPVYSLPYVYSSELTLESVTDEGVVFLDYQNSSIVLKIKDRWENTSHVIQTRPPSYDGTICTEEIVLTNSFYNAGFLDAKKMRVRYFTL
jgi:hypothetical protein